MAAEEAAPVKDDGLDNRAYEVLEREFQEVREGPIRSTCLSDSFGL